MHAADLVLGLLQFTTEFPFRRQLAALLCSSMLVGVVMASFAVRAADQPDKLDQPSSFHIAAGSLESALIEFSRETHIQVVVSAPVANISVPAVDGHRKAREVLTALLNATGLTYIVVGETVTVRPANPSTHQPPPVNPTGTAVQTASPNRALH